MLKFTTAGESHGQALISILEGVILPWGEPSGHLRRSIIPGLAEPLSEREIEVLRLVVAGLSNREIARQLVFTTGTAKTHIHNICGKLRVRNRTEAAMRARELGLV